MVKIPGKLAKTPEDAERSCTDICCLLIYAAVMAGLGVCVWYGMSQGDISRLDSLPDYQGTQCVNQFIFFPEDWPPGVEGINLHKHVCVDSCPTNSSSTVVTYLFPDESTAAAEERRLGGLLDAMATAGMAETNGLLMAPTVSPSAAAPVETAEPTAETALEKAEKALEAKTKAAPATEEAHPAPAAPATPAAPAQPAPTKPEEGVPPMPSMKRDPNPYLTWSPNGPTIAPLHIRDVPKQPGAAPAWTAPAGRDVPEGAEEVSLKSYPTIPLGGVVCLPKVGEYQGKIKDLIGSDVFFSTAMQVSDLVKNYEVLIIAAVVAIAMSFIFLFVVEWFGSVLVTVSMFLVVAVFSWLGFVCLQAAITGSAASEYGERLAEHVHFGISGTQGDMILGSVSVGLACIVLLCACFQCNKCMAAAAAVKDAADCLMTMPSLMLEPLVSFLLKIPFFLVGAAGLMVLITSGNYQNVDLTKPETLIHPDNFAVVCAAYWAFACLWTMEILHYTSVFVVIYVSEVWFFKHYGEGVRGSFCSMCGPTLVLKAWCAAVTKHLGSLIYGAILVSFMRPLRWIVNMLLAAQEVADNPMCSLIMASVEMVIGSCLTLMHRILDLTSQIGFMQIAYTGNMGFCEAQKHALSLVFAEKGKWAATEGLATAFVVLGVGGISAGTCVLVYMIVNTLPRYIDGASPQYISDPRSIAVASGVVALLMSMSILHHFITITDTIAYCRGLVLHETALGDPGQEERRGSCWNCFQKAPTARETEALLTRPAMETPRSG